MEANQLKLLLKLAKEIEKEVKNKKSVIGSLQSAKILDKNGKFTGHYNNLNKLFITM